MYILCEIFRGRHECAVRRAHPGAPDIGFVGDYERSGDRGHWGCSALVVVADSGNYERYLVCRHAEVVQQTESHYRAALGVVYAVYHVADVVHICGNFSEFAGALLVAQRGQYHVCRRRSALHMRVGMLRVSDGAERCVGVVDVCLYIFVATYIFVGDVTQFCYLKCASA